MNSSLPLLGDKQLLSFLCLRTRKTSSLGVLCTHIYRSRVPRCIWNALCHFQTIHANIFYIHILTKLIHTHHVIQSMEITSKLAHMD